MRILPSPSASSLEARDHLLNIMGRTNAIACWSRAAHVISINRKTTWNSLELKRSNMTGKSGYNAGHLPWA